jgi:acetoin utilization deacetylase AcuC-like enzyme
MIRAFGEQLGRSQCLIHALTGERIEVARGITDEHGAVHRRAADPAIEGTARMEGRVAQNRLVDARRQTRQLRQQRGRGAAWIRTDEGTVPSRVHDDREIGSAGRHRRETGTEAIADVHLADIGCRRRHCDMEGQRQLAQSHARSAQAEARRHDGSQTVRADDQTCRDAPRARAHARHETIGTMSHVDYMLVHYTDAGGAGGVDQDRVEHGSLDGDGATWCGPVAVGETRVERGPIGCHDAPAAQHRVWRREHAVEQAETFEQRAGSCTQTVTARLRARKPVTVEEHHVVIALREQERSHGAGRTAADNDDRGSFDVGSWRHGCAHRAAREDSTTAIMHAPGVPSVKVFYADQFVLPLPPGHRFPMEKYSLLRERVTAELDGIELLVPDAASDADLLRAHDADYVERVATGTLDAGALRRIGFPWSQGMVERSRRSVGATIAASRAALADGVSANLAGGTHHACAGHGEGFCVFNDVAVAIRTMQAEGRVARAAVIDTDVHQGNGTAAILGADEAVFTFSVHGAGNYPYRKEPGSLDIALPDAAGDDEYLAAVATGVNAAMDYRPDIIYYVSGADAYAGDRLGRLDVSVDALARRDDLVFVACARGRVPVVLVMAGGYAADISDTVAIHLASVRAAQACLRASAISTSR